MSQTTIDKFGGTDAHKGIISMYKKSLEERVQRWIIIAGVLIILFLLNASVNGELPQILNLLKTPKVQLFTVVLIAILLEGFTFLLLGSCLSGIIEIFVPQGVLEKRFPQKNLPAAATGSLLGLCFPVCSVSLSYFPVYHASGWQIPDLY